MIYGEVPSDGLIGSTTGVHLLPNLRYGQRVSGTITVSSKNRPPDGVEYRLVVNGVPWSSKTIDTTQFQDGPTAIGLQAVDANAAGVRNGSVVVVINNGDSPWVSMEGQVVVGKQWHDTASSNSLAWAKVDVKPPVPYPIDPQLDQHPKAVDDLARQRLVSDKIWVVQGLSHQPTTLWRGHPYPMKNEHGDVFISYWNPQGGGSGVTAANAKPYVENAPAFDGPRGVGNFSPYSSLSPHPKILPSGETGWIGVSKDGRVFELDITGEVRTIFGPRSVDGVIGTDVDLLNFTLDDRLASGEKEFVGDDNGLRLNLPHDIWPCDMFPFEGIIADTGNNRVAEIQFHDHENSNGSISHGGRLMRSWALDGVTSVCASLEMQQDPSLNIIWVAANPEGLWCQRHVVGNPGDNPHESGGMDHSFTGHQTTLEKLADIPNAFWVRCIGHRVFVFTTDLGIYEYNAETMELTERLVRRAKQETFLFANVDLNGSIGPINRIYWGSASQKNGGYGSSKVALFWFDPGIAGEDTPIVTGTVSRHKIANQNNHNNWCASIDPLGHYMWGVAIHSTLPIFLTCGMVSSSWYMWYACLGSAFQPDAYMSFPPAGNNLFRNGSYDKYIGLSSIYGYNGAGGIGYSCDEFRYFVDFASAKDAMLSTLHFPTAMSQSDREALALIMWEQRTRKHYQDGEVIPIPDPQPDPEPDPDPDPDPGPDPDPLTLEERVSALETKVASIEEILGNV